MSKTFSTMKTNIGTEVGDTSTAFALVIGSYINKRYHQILRAINWNVFNDGYTIAVTGGTQDYTLPSDFGKEIACVDTTNGKEIVQVDLQWLWSNYPDDMTSSGTVERYAIWIDESGNKTIRFHYNPSSSITVALPYIVKPANLSATTDTPILPIEDLIEIGAIADAWRYKRQGSKANDFEVRFNVELTNYIWEQENQPNRVVQFSPTTYNRDNLY